MARVKTAAERDRARVADFIRDALDSYVAGRREPTIQIEAPSGSRVYVYRGQPPLSISTTPAIVVPIAPVTSESVGVQ